MSTSRTLRSDKVVDHWVLGPRKRKTKRKMTEEPLENGSRASTSSHGSNHQMDNPKILAEQELELQKQEPPKKRDKTAGASQDMSTQVDTATEEKGTQIGGATVDKCTQTDHALSQVTNPTSNITALNETPMREYIEMIVFQNQSLDGENLKSELALTCLMGKAVPEDLYISPSLEFHSDSKEMRSARQNQGTWQNWRAKGRIPLKSTIYRDMLALFEDLQSWIAFDYVFAFSGGLSWEEDVAKHIMLSEPEPHINVNSYRLPNARKGTAVIKKIKGHKSFVCPICHLMQENKNAKQHIERCSPEKEIGEEKKKFIWTQLKFNRFFVRNDKMAEIGIPNRNDNILARFVLMILGGIFVNLDLNVVPFPKILEDFSQ